MRIGSMALVILILAGNYACGGDGSAAPDAAVSGDGGMFDASICACFAPDLLPSTRLVRPRFEVVMDQTTRMGVGAGCEEDELLLGGSCSLRTLESNMLLNYSGFFFRLPEIWSCFYQKQTGQDHTMVAHALCLQPFPGSGEPSQDAGLVECDCPPVEPLENRISRVEQNMQVAGQSYQEVESSCSPGEILIAGSCGLYPLTTPGTDDDLGLINGGFDPEDENLWRCAWNNEEEVTHDVEATVVCLRPPSPGTAEEADPVMDRIYRSVTTDEISPGMTYSILANCELGDYILSGGCTADTAQLTDHDVALIRTGFPEPEDNRPSTWRCTWENRSADNVNVQITATAVCVRPASSSARE